MFPISLYNFCLRVVLSLLFFATASAARRSNRALNYLILVSICSLSVAPHQLNRAHPLYSVQDCCQIFSCSLRLFSHLILVIKSVLLSFLNTIASRLCWTSSHTLPRVSGPFGISPLQPYQWSRWYISTPYGKLLSADLSGWSRSLLPVKTYWNIIRRTKCLRLVSKMNPVWWLYQDKW